MTKKKVQGILSKMAIATFLTGIVISVLGVFLFYLGAEGATEFTFFDQTFSSTNVGIAAIFIGASLIVITIKRILNTLEKTIPTQEGKNAQGKLKIDNINITQEDPPRKAEDIRPVNCKVDFWVTNTGGSEVVITGVVLEVVDTARAELTKGPMKSSATYDADITELRQAGQKKDIHISQVIKPGESDRFTLSLVASLGSGVFGVWKLRAFFQTNFGKIQSEEFEIWLPFPDKEFTLEEIKKIQLESSKGLV